MLRRLHKRHRVRQAETTLRWLAQPSASEIPNPYSHHLAEYWYRLLPPIRAIQRPVQAFRPEIAEDHPSMIGFVNHALQIFPNLSSGTHALSYEHRRLSRTRAMCPEEGTYLAHRQRNPLLGLLPREHTHFGVWREHRGLHGDGVRMRRDIIRQDQYGRLAIAHEIACDREDEVGIGAVHLGQIFLDHVHRDLRPALDQFRTPVLHIVFVEKIAHLRTRSAGLRQHGCDNTIRCPPQEVPDKWAADAEAHHHELIYAQMIHHTEMVICV